MDENNENKNVEQALAEPRKPKAPAVISLLLTGVPFLQIFFYGYAAFYKKDKWLAKQCSYSLILSAIYVASALLINIFNSLFYFMGSFMQLPLSFGANIFDFMGGFGGYPYSMGIVSVVRVLITFVFMLIRVVPWLAALIQLLAKGDINLPVLNKLLVCFPKVKEQECAAADNSEKGNDEQENIEITAEGKNNENNGS